MQIGLPERSVIRILRHRIEDNLSARTFHIGARNLSAIFTCHAHSWWNCLVVSGAARVQVPAFEIFVPGRQDGFSRNPGFRSAHLI